jgi:F-type H+-transporting ATPase subunit delta
MSAPVRKLILLLADRDRLALVADVASTFTERLMDHQKVLRGEVTSAAPLAPDKLRALEEGLGRATGRTVMLSARVDPAILGGAVTRIGSTVYDGSITMQLERIKQRLIESAQ